MLVKEMIAVCFENHVKQKNMHVCEIHNYALLKQGYILLPQGFKGCFRSSSLKGDFLFQDYSHTSVYQMNTMNAPQLVFFVD